MLFFSDFRFPFQFSPKCTVSCAACCHAVRRDPPLVRRLRTFLLPKPAKRTLGKRSLSHFRADINTLYRSSYHRLSGGTLVLVTVNKHFYTYYGWRQEENFQRRSSASGRCRHVKQNCFTVKMCSQATTSRRAVVTPRVRRRCSVVDDVNNSVSRWTI